MRLFGLVVPVLVVLLTACGSGSSNAADAGASGSDAPDPCALLSDEWLQAHIDIGDAEVSRRASEHSPHPLCMVSWPHPNAEGIQADFQKKMMEYAQAKARGEDAAMPKIGRLNNEVNLTIVKDRFGSPEEAASAFDSAMNIIREGMTSSTNKDIKVLGHDVEPVTRVGDKAAWVPKMSQISVQNGRRMFHLSVRAYDDPETNRAKAVEMAKVLLEHIR